MRIKLDWKNFLRKERLNLYELSRRSGVPVSTLHSSAKSGGLTTNLIARIEITVPAIIKYEKE